MKDPNAVALGRKGGKARMTTMSAEERKRRAREAGLASGLARTAKKNALPVK